MIVKYREFPKEITVLKAILRRFPLNEQMKTELENKVSRKLAGYKGEKELDYHLSQFDHTQFKILHDVRIPHNNTHFQIDSLLISNTFMLSIDSKNYSGYLDLNTEFNHLLQTSNGVEKVYPDPILQTKIQASQLKSFLLNHQISPPPIEYLVTVSNSQAMIRNPLNSRQVSERVCKAPAVPFKIQSFNETYKKESLSAKEIRRIEKLLLKSHEPYLPDIYSMNLPLVQIRKGVYCPACESIGMSRIHGTWVCPQCGHLSKAPHIAAVKDFFLIFGPAITSRQFSDFLGLPSIHQAKRLLLSVDFKSTGPKKKRIYTPGKDFDLWN